VKTCIASHIIASLHINYEDIYIYCYMQVVISMKISIILLLTCNLVCLNYCLINYDLNKLLKQFAC
jgi:hypothetical protein